MRSARAPTGVWPAACRASATAPRPAPGRSGARWRRAARRGPQRHRERGPAAPSSSTAAPPAGRPQAEDDEQAHQGQRDDGRDHRERRTGPRVVASVHGTRPVVPSVVAAGSPGLPAARRSRSTWPTRSSWSGRASQPRGRRRGPVPAAAFRASRASKSSRGGGWCSLNDESRPPPVDDRAVLVDGEVAAVLAGEALPVGSAGDVAVVDAHDAPHQRHLVGVRRVGAQARPRVCTTLVGVVTVVRSTRVETQGASQPSPSSPRLPMRQRVPPSSNQRVRWATHWPELQRRRAAAPRPRDRPTCRRPASGGCAAATPRGGAGSPRCRRRAAGHQHGVERGAGRVGEQRGQHPGRGPGRLGGAAAGELLRGAVGQAPPVVAVARSWSHSTSTRARSPEEAPSAPTIAAAACSLARTGR